MIQDSDVKIAKNPEEAFWIELKEKCEKEIANNKRGIIINEEIIKLCNRKIER